LCVFCVCVCIMCVCVCIVCVCVYRMCVVPDQLLLTSGFDKTVNLWDMNTCSVMKCYKVG